MTVRRLPVHSTPEGGFNSETRLGVISARRLRCADMSDRHLCQAIRLVLPIGGLFWRDSPSMASSQRLPHGHNGRLTIALQDELILGPP